MDDQRSCLGFGEPSVGFAETRREGGGLGKGLLHGHGLHEIVSRKKGGGRWGRWDLSAVLSSLFVPVVLSRRLGSGCLSLMRVACWTGTPLERNVLLAATLPHCSHLPILIFILGAVEFEEG